MKSLLRCVVALSAIVLPLTAHADPVTYTGTITLTDTSNVNNVSGSGAFSFVDPPTATETAFYNVAAVGPAASGDDVTLDVAFSAPGTGNGNFTGTFFDFKIFGVFTVNTITWNGPTTENVDLTNGSVVRITAEQVSGFPACVAATGECATGDVSISVLDNDPALASTPEPSSLMLLGTGLLGSVAVVRRRFAL